jgi:hypothetical protein
MSRSLLTATTTVAKVARVAYTFVMMNYAAVAGLVAATRGRRIWR